MEQTEEFLEIVGVVHKNYPELDDPNYYGTYLKPSEFDEAIKYMEGLPVTVGHTRDKDGNVAQSVGKVVKAFRGDKGEIQAKIYIPIDSEVSSRVKYDILDNPLNPKRNLSFSAEVIKAEGPGVPGISDKTEFNYGFDFSEIAIVDVPGVPQSKIKSAVLGHKNLNTGEITYKRKEIYNSFNKQPIIVEKMDSSPPPPQQQASPPQAQVTRGIPQNMDQVRVGPPAGGELQKDLQEQDKQLGLQTHTQQLTPAQQHLANQIATMQAEAQKWASEVAKAQEMLTAAQKQKEELDAYNNKLAEEKRIREEEETKKQNAKLLEREKEKWAAAELSVYASNDATAIAEFEKARDQHFNNVALGKIDPVLKWTMFAQDCSANLAITGVQERQKRQMDVNNENQRILMENHKRVKEELDKKEGRSPRSGKSIKNGSRVYSRSK